MKEVHKVQILKEALEGQKARDVKVDQIEKEVHTVWILKWVQGDQIMKKV